MFKRILFGYAGDPAGRDAAVLAEQLARLCDGKPSVAFPVTDVSEQHVRDELRSLLGDSPLMAGARYHWTNSSWPIRALHELADWESAELIVFGAAQFRLERASVGC
jgi:nucleotide-binding universal stress UspA family protein